MNYTINDGSKPFNTEIASLIIQAWNDTIVSKFIDEQAGKFYLMDSAP
jgi:hypothetical protein